MSSPKTFTQRLLEDAGIRPGMRVLDLGCGPGAVSRLLAQLVGETGEVFGVDKSEAMLDRARAIASQQQTECAPTSFRYHDLRTPLPSWGLFDAVVARRVLMYLPEPAEVLKHACAALTRDGVLVLEETDSTMTPGHVEALPLHTKALGWIWETVTREGANVQMGMALPSTLAQAGLKVAHLRAEAVIEGQAEHSLAQIIAAIQPRILELQVANEAEIEVETLQARLDAERPDDVVFVSGMAFGAWAHKAQTRRLA